jgi:Zn-dependent protease with chaperone function
MTKGAGRSFTLLVGAGAGLELTGAAVTCLGLDTIAQCYWAWFPGAGLPPAVCAKPIAGAGFHLFVPAAVLVALLVATALLGAARAIRLRRGVARLSAMLGPVLPEVPDAVAVAGRRAHASFVEVRGDREPYAVCIGMLAPRLVISTGLVQLLTDDELVAVLAHEERHRRRYAPLRQLFARVTVRALFFIPVLGDLLDAHLLAEEVVADQEAAAIAGRHALVVALKKLSTAVSAEGIAAFADLSSISARLRAIGTASATPIGVCPLRVAASVGALLVLVLVVLWMPLIALP